MQSACAAVALHYAPAVAVIVERVAPAVRISNGVRTDAEIAAAFERYLAPRRAAVRRDSYAWPDLVGGTREMVRGLNVDTRGLS